MDRRSGIKAALKSQKSALLGSHSHCVMPDTSKVLPKFLENMMNSLIFQEEAKGKASKSVNQANINATMMRNINVPVPSIPEQKKFVAKIDALEKQIADAQAVIDGATARKQSILQKHL